MIRDDLKDAKYFENYIAYQVGRISNKKEKIVSCGNDEAKANRVRLSLLKYQIDMVFAMFSAGEESGEMRKVLDEALATASAIQTVDYESLLNLLSLAIFLEKEDGADSLINRHNNVINKDKLLNCLARFCKNGTKLWAGGFQIKKAFDGLNDLDSASGKTDVLLKYLEEWYELHSEAAWYDSHKGDNDTYVGYWSFESAALARIFRLDDQKLKENRYFPSL